MNVNRRDFMKTGSAVVAGSILIPPLLQSCESIKITPDVQSYLDHFEVTVNLLQKVIAEAMSKGGDYADLFFEHKISNNIGLQDKKVNRASSTIDFGVGVRVLKGDQTGFAYSEDVTLPALLNAAKLAASIANSTGKFSPSGVTEKLPASYYKIGRKWNEVSVQEKVPFVQKVNDRIFGLDEKVIKVNAFMNDETSFVLFYNSTGTLTYDFRPMISFGAGCIMQRGTQIENAYAARSFRKGFEWMTDGLVDELAAEAVDKTNILFDATKPKQAKCPW